MYNITVYYDYHEGIQVPLSYIITFSKGGLNWLEENLYIPMESPFELHGVEDYVDSFLGLAVHSGDLTIPDHKPGYFGIYLPDLRRRIVEAGYDYWDVEQLVIRVTDLEELLQMDFIREKVWGGFDHEGAC
jgi:hypothetical protein